VKPAVDGNNDILLPLLKSTNESFGVEAVFVKMADPYMHNDVENINNVELVMPCVDLPINVLCITVFMPNGYRYDDWHGNMKEVHYFSRTVTRRMDNQPRVQLYYNAVQQMEWNKKSAPSSHMRKSAPPPMKMKRRQNRQRHSDLECVYSVTECQVDMMNDEDESSEEERFKSPVPQKPDSSSGPVIGDAIAGIKPLKLNVDSLKCGVQFMFERLLANAGDRFAISTQYRAERVRPFRAELTVGTGCLRSCSIM